MSARLDLPPHVEVDEGTAAYLAGDPSFGLSSVPSDIRRGHLDLRAPGGRHLAVFWALDDPGHAAPAPSAEIAAEWAALAAVAPRGTILEVATGFLGHRVPHWRLVDLLRLDGVDARGLPTADRYQALLGIYRQAAGLRFSKMELAHLVGPAEGKAAYAVEGPGRQGDRLAFRRLTAAHDDPWFLAPAGWTAKRSG